MSIPRCAWDSSFCTPLLPSLKSRKHLQALQPPAGVQQEQPRNLTEGVPPATWVTSISK